MIKFIQNKPWWTWALFPVEYTTLCSSLFSLAYSWFDHIRLFISKCCKKIIRMLSMIIFKHLTNIKCWSTLLSLSILYFSSKFFPQFSHFRSSKFTIFSFILHPFLEQHKTGRNPITLGRCITFCVKHNIKVSKMSDIFLTQGRKRRKTQEITNLHHY